MFSVLTCSGLNSFQAVQTPCEFTISCDERVELLTDDRVKLLKEANCKQVYLGVESGDEELRKLVLERTMSNELLRKGVDRLHDNGIRALRSTWWAYPEKTDKKLFPRLNSTPL